VQPSTLTQHYLYAIQYTNVSLSLYSAEHVTLSFCLICGDRVLYSRTGNVFHFCSCFIFHTLFCGIMFTKFCLCATIALDYYFFFFFFPWFPLCTCVCVCTHTQISLSLFCIYGSLSVQYLFPMYCKTCQSFEVVTFGLLPSVTFLWFLTNVLGLYVHPFFRVQWVLEVTALLL
jgi:hypothetical protein